MDRLDGVGQPGGGGLRRARRGGWTLAVFAASFVIMNLLYGAVGYVRLLGLAHVLFWTPLFAYLWPRLSQHESATPFRLWLRVLFATNALSLIVDYSDVIRYLLGDRS